LRNRSAARTPQRIRRILGIVTLVGHRVVAAFVKGMAPQNPAAPQPETPPRPEAFDGGVRVARAAGIEAAARTQQGTDGELVSADGPHQYLAQRYHRCVIVFQCASRLARSSLGLADRAASRAETVTSTFGNECWFKRKDSRARRLMRLRATAVPKARVAMLNPNRG